MNQYQEIKPNLFIVGAAKCATTSLYRYLRDHPQIYMSPVKEPKFFSRPYRPIPGTGPGDERVEENAIKDMDTYMSLFQDAGSYPVRGEASVDYLYYSQAAEDIHAFNPDAKILICLRNPIDRAYSGYTDHHRSRETLSFHEALHDEENRTTYEFIWQYKKLGLYYESVKHYMDVFGPDRVMIVFFKDIKTRLNDTISGICRFLGVDDTYQIQDVRRFNPSGTPNAFMTRMGKLFPWVKNAMKKMMPNRYLRLRSKSLVKEPMREDDREYLRAYYREDVAKLSGLLGKDLSHWLQ
jgi:hypothetical protein